MDSASIGSALRSEISTGNTLDSVVGTIDTPIDTPNEKP
jgi:hypothetical protein